MGKCIETMQTRGFQEVAGVKNESSCLLGM